MFNLLKQLFTNDAIDILSGKLQKRAFLIKELMEDLEEQEEIIRRYRETIESQGILINSLRASNADLVKQNKDYYDLLFKGCELKNDQV